jgi:hypothetical protein
MCIMAFKCKMCNTEFGDEKHLENHKKVHGRKEKEYDGYNWVDSASTYGSLKW